MKVLWIGKELSEEIREYVHSELRLPGKKIETETARRAILFAIRVKPDEFQKAWKDGLLEYAQEAEG